MAIIGDCLMNIKRTIHVIIYFLLCVFIISVTACDSVRYEHPLEICFIRSGDVWVMDEDGTNQKQLTFTGTNEWPSWSPDGKYIVYGSQISGHTEIFLMDSNGDNQRQLTISTGDENYYCPTWLYDGKKIVYNRFESTSLLSYIGSMDKQGNKDNEYLLTGVNTRLDVVTVSNDGTIVTYRWSGGGLINLFSFKNLSNTNILPPTNMSVSWVPQGNVIAYIRGTYIYLYDIIMGINIFSYSSVLIENTPLGISWRPSGDAIVLASNLVGSEGIYIFNFNSNQFVRITDNSTDKHPCFIGKPR